MFSCPLRAAMLVLTHHSERGVFQRCRLLFEIAGVLRREMQQRLRALCIEDGSKSVLRGVAWKEARLRSS